MSSVTQGRRKRPTSPKPTKGDQSVSELSAPLGLRNSPMPLLRWEELPQWQRDNEHILTSYRAPSNSWRGSVASIFALHNETVNIYSHLFGALLFCLLPLYTLREVYPRQADADLWDVMVFAVFFYGVAICFFLSASFHVLASHSPEVAGFELKLDYLGVVLLMWGATIPTVYYGFYGEPTLQLFYCSLVIAQSMTLTLGDLY
ncbi:hypothetical protein H2200_005111 [Cladophialophora chaetospira]|uniref:Uncharacterized protein n=1 Tax=Cladophialophora chaetospira TaxID=386627 RepID=A0AA39CIN2_9EURO|nr:hypothetical protein H2200_005111 [Cladophialophora chaetospira]